MDLDNMRKYSVIDKKTGLPLKKRKCKTKYTPTTIKKECLNLLKVKGNDVMGDNNCYGEFNSLKRCFYWVKSYICIYFNKIKHQSCFGLPEDLIDVKWFSDYHQYFNGDLDVWTQSVLSVGKGIFNNWYCIIYETGN